MYFINTNPHEICKWRRRFLKKKKKKTKTRQQHLIWWLSSPFLNLMCGLCIISSFLRVSFFHQKKLISKSYSCKMLFYACEPTHNEFPTQHLLIVWKWAPSHPTILSVNRQFLCKYTIYLFEISIKLWHTKIRWDERGNRNRYKYNDIPIGTITWIFPPKNSSLKGFWSFTRALVRVHIEKYINHWGNVLIVEINARKTCFPILLLPVVVLSIVTIVTKTKWPIGKLGNISNILIFICFHCKIQCYHQHITIWNVILLFFVLLQNNRGNIQQVQLQKHIADNFMWIEQSRTKKNWFRRKWTTSDEHFIFIHNYRVAILCNFLWNFKNVHDLSEWNACQLWCNYFPRIGFGANER